VTTNARVQDVSFPASLKRLGRYLGLRFGLLLVLGLAVRVRVRG